MIFDIYIEVKNIEDLAVVLEGDTSHDELEAIYSFLLSYIEDQGGLLIMGYFFLDDFAKNSSLEHVCKQRKMTEWNRLKKNIFTYSVDPGLIWDNQKII